jgi:hypothetical protein
MFAQTGPVYIAQPTPLLSSGAPQASGEPRLTAAMFFLARLDDLESEYSAHGYFPLPSQQQALNAAVAQARALYTSLFSISGVTTPSLQTPWELKTIWPNPSEGDTHFVYRVPGNGGHHELAVYDASGRVVRRLFSGTRPAGDYDLEWDGRDSRGTRAASGVYFVRVSPTGANPVARKLVLLH